MVHRGARRGGARDGRGRVYIAARSVSLGAVGRKVDVVERAIRRGTGQDPELAEALARDESGDYS